MFICAPHWYWYSFFLFASLRALLSSFFFKIPSESLAKTLNALKPIQRNKFHLQCQKQNKSILPIFPHHFAIVSLLPLFQAVVQKYNIIDIYWKRYWERQGECVCCCCCCCSHNSSQCGNALCDTFQSFNSLHTASLSLFTKMSLFLVLCHNRFILAVAVALVSPSRDHSSAHFNYNRFASFQPLRFLLPCPILFCTVVRLRYPCAQCVSLSCFSIEVGLVSICRRV